MKFPYFGKKNIEPVKVERKNTHGVNWATSLLNVFGGNIVAPNIPPNLAYQFYHKISPLQGTISKIHDAIGTLPLVLREEDNPEILIKEHPILTLLKKPSPLTTKKKFLTQSAKSLMLTREVYIVARGPVMRPPLELVFVDPSKVQIFEDIESTWPIKINTNINGDRRDYFREDVKGRWRYFDKMHLNEIFPYIAEPDDGIAGNSFRGISPLTSLKDELLSYSASVMGNTAGIENAGRPSGIITPEDDELTEDQYEDLSQSVKESIGAVNSGKVWLLPHRVKAAFERWAPKDMDYEVLQQNIKTNIWNLYSMPLPIVSEKGQTYSNFAEAQTAFYDEAVNENWHILADALKWALETRYDLDGLIIDYNPYEVPALKRRAINIMQDMTKAEALTIDEIRSFAGYDKVDDGDNVMISIKKTTLEAAVEGPSFTDPVMGPDPDATT